MKRNYPILLEKEKPTNCCYGVYLWMSIKNPEMTTSYLMPLWWGWKWLKMYVPLLSFSDHLLDRTVIPPLFVRSWCFDSWIYWKLYSPFSSKINQRIIFLLFLSNTEGWKICWWNQLDFGRFSGPMPSLRASWASLQRIDWYILPSLSQLIPSKIGFCQSLKNELTPKYPLLKSMLGSRILQRVGFWTIFVTHLALVFNIIQHGMLDIITPGKKTAGKKLLKSVGIEAIVCSYPRFY